MKKVLSFVIVMAFAVTASVFAADQTAGKENSLPKIVGDSVKDFKIRDKDKIKTSKTVTNFQAVSDALKEGAAKAKNHSKRKTK
jgi:hypothetical protein